MMYVYDCPPLYFDPCEQTYVPGGGGQGLIELREQSDIFEFFIIILSYISKSISVLKFIFLQYPMTYLNNIIPSGNRGGGVKINLYTPGKYYAYCLCFQGRPGSKAGSSRGSTPPMEWEHLPVTPTPFEGYIFPPPKFFFLHFSIYYKNHKSGDEGGVVDIHPSSEFILGVKLTPNIDNFFYFHQCDL